MKSHTAERNTFTTTTALFFVVVLLYSSTVQPVAGADWSNSFIDATPENWPQLTNPAGGWRDLNGDGYPELLLIGADSAGTTFYANLWINKGDGTFTDSTSSPNFFGGNQGCMAFGDFNVDQKVDVYAAANAGTGGLKGGLFKSAGAATTGADVPFTPVGSNTPPAAWQCMLTFFDWDQNGLPDIVFCSPFSCVLYNNTDGSGTFAQTTPTDLQVFAGGSLGGVDVADFNKDGYKDVVIVGNGGGGIYSAAVFLGGKGTLKNSGIAMTGLSWGDGRFIDVDQDGWPDVVLSGVTKAPATPSTLLYQSKAGTNLTLVASSGLVGLTDSALDVGDFNADGFPDIVISGYDGSTFVSYLYINNRDFTFSDSKVALTGSYRPAVSFVDFNKDGLLDIFISGNGKTTLYKNLGLPCANGLLTILPGEGWTCSCFEGWTGNDCSALLCPTIRCLETGACVDKLSDCITSTSTTTGGTGGEPLAYVAQRIISAQVVVNTTSETIVQIFSSLDAGLRGSVTVPPNLFGDSETTIILTVKAVSLSNISNTNVDISNIFSVVIDLSFSENVPSNFSQPITITLLVNKLPPGACLAYLRGNTWVCEDYDLILVGNGLVSGQTLHFTQFGVLLDSSDNGSGGGGGDGFDNVLLVPIIVSVVGAGLVVVVVSAAILVFFYWRRRKIRRSIESRSSTSYDE